MKVVYFGYHATFGASLMAAIHAGIYAGNKLPPNDWIMSHFETCVLHRMQFGNLTYSGIDEQIREIYYIGCKRHSRVIKHAMASASNMFELREQIHFVDIRKMEGVIPHVIAFFMRYYFSQCLCAAVFSFWFRSKYESFVKLVEDQKGLLDTIVV